MLQKIILFYFIFLSLTLNAQQTYESITVEGESRYYYQYLPTAYNPNTEELPIVIILHGLGGNALQMTSAGFNYIADTARFIPLYLQGQPNVYGQNAWNNGTLLSSTPNDVLFISRLIDTINAQYDIDLSRVYMTGISMGSIMTYKAIRHLDDRIAAVSCHIGTMSTEEIADYNPTYPIPVQHIHGTNDQTVPYDSGALPSLSLVPETIDKLKSINGWSGDSTVTAIPDNVADGITIDKIVYDCTTPLELWRMNNADHIFLTPTVNDTAGIFVTWYWFRQYQHPNPSTASIENKSIQNEQIEFYPNPLNNGQLFVKKFQNIESINIYNLQGQLVFNSIITDEYVHLNELSTGIYAIEFIQKNQLIYRDKLIIE